MGSMQRCNDRIGTMALLAAVPLVLAACSGPDLSQIKIPKVDAGTLVSPNFNEFQKREESRGPVKQSDLVDASGRCAESGAGQKPDIAGGGQGSEAATAPAAPTLQPIALKMTECEVVRAIGSPQDVMVGSNERGDRAVKLEFRTGERSGVYHFVDGRLVSIERLADAPAAPVKKPPSTKSKQGT
jgi:hypothetical protein